MSESRIYYFAYGADLDIRLMEERIGYLPEWQKAYAIGYKLVFNHWSNKWNGKVANLKLTNADTDEVHGAVYTITNEDLNKLTKNSQGIEPTEITIIMGNEQKKAFAYIWEKEADNPQTEPPKDYFDRVIEGLIARGYGQSEMKSFALQATKYIDPERSRTPESSFSEGSFSKESFTNYRTKEKQLGDILKTYIHNDKWTVKDALGYHSYAFALAKFITAKETKTPLCISIQAPWGGGKTSLMRMIQKMLDSDAQRDLEDESDKGTQLSEERPKLKEILAKLKTKLISKQKEEGFPRVEEPKSFDEVLDPRITIWFNAWKYESTEQVWAGLADSIVKGVAERLEPAEREWFYLTLNLRRVDKNSIRNWIYGEIWRQIWTCGKSWISIGLIGAFISGIIGIHNLSNQFNALIFGIPLFGGVSAYTVIAKMSQIKNEPADVTLGKYVNVPNYNERLGFIHHVKTDLDLVFKSLPTKHRKLVIFIDDLDRCSPDNVARVIEGINLFLAGEFPGCVFIIGMDAEMVSAALEVAHEKVMSKLPSYASHTPLGWRFMDKFVQLPIIIPPPIRDRVLGYADGLVEFIRNQSIEPTKKKDFAEQKPTNNPQPRGKPPSRKTDFLDSNQQEDIKKMNEKINEMSDTDRQFLEQVADGAADFSNNPREVKRFVNSLRFYRFLMTVQNTEKNPTFEQVGRWIILSLRWPQLVRWIYSSPNIESKVNSSDKNNTNFIRDRLEKLEGLAKDPAKWTSEFAKLLTLNSNGHAPVWVGDLSIREFFLRESEKFGGEPLSAKAGISVY